MTHFLDKEESRTQYVHNNAKLKTSFGSKFPENDEFVIALDVGKIVDFGAKIKKILICPNFEFSRKT